MINKSQAIRELGEYFREVGNFSPEQSEHLARSWFPRKPKIDGDITYWVKPGPITISKLSSWTDIACDLDVPAAVGEYEAMMKRLRQ